MMWLRLNVDMAVSLSTGQSEIVRLSATGNAHYFEEAGGDVERYTQGERFPAGSVC